MHHNDNRTGAVAPLLAVLSTFLLGVVAFAIDYGYLVFVKSEMQRSADAAVLAAVQDLVPAADGTQNLDQVRATARQYARLNVEEADSFAVRDADIQIGRYDETNIYTQVDLLNDGIMDTVRITLRRDNVSNGPIPLYFGKVLGIESMPMRVTATAVLRRGSAPRAGADVLPFAVHVDTWNYLSDGDLFNVYDGGKVTDANGNQIPGNFGTVDIGYLNNSTSDMVDQIAQGLRQIDLDALYVAGRITTNKQLDAPVWLQADTGLSVGIKSAIQAIYGQNRIIPLFNNTNGGTGNTAEFYVVAWGVVAIVDSSWKGAKNTYVTAKKSYMYQSPLVVHQDLSTADSANVKNAYTAPALVQ